MIDTEIYNRYFLETARAKEPILKEMTLSSNELNPKKELFLTSFNHFEHLWTADLVNESIRGSTINESHPSINSRIKHTK
mmetsp:Transcript_26750/g.23612  ORF Transcript_26750/g.23612 Transcript_26750/m.23612 type:complete len:80 (-) Transcript_26750:81-320(-)